MRYVANNLTTDEQMALVEHIGRHNPNAVRRDFRPGKTRVYNISNGTADASAGEFVFEVQFTAGRAILKAQRGDPFGVLPMPYRDRFSHGFDAKPLH